MQPQSSEISSGKADAENSGWYTNGDTNNGVLQVVGMELYNGSANKDGTVYIQNLLILDQDGNPIDLSSCEWKDEIKLSCIEKSLWLWRVVTLIAEVCSAHDALCMRRREMRSARFITKSFSPARAGNF